MRTVFFVSDSTGLTAEMLGHSLLTQFGHERFRRLTLPFIDSPDKARAAIDTIRQQGQRDQQRPIVFCTLVDPQVKRHFDCSEALILDLCSPLLTRLEQELGQEASHRVGAAHGIDNLQSYMARIEAVNYAMSHDDGGSLRDLEQAELILLGVSRSGKTPTCLYLALHFGLQVANYPLTPEDFALRELPPVLRPWHHKLFGLTIDPERLAQIRQERLPNSHYASLETCRQEVSQAEVLMQRWQIPCLSTTRLSIEELAVTILQHSGLLRRGGQTPLEN